MSGTAAPSAVRWPTGTRPPTTRRCSWPSGARWSSGALGGERPSTADDFFTGFLETALAADELLTEVRIPKATGAGWSFQKFNRRAQDWAIVGVAAVHNGRTGIGLVNMDTTPDPGRRVRAGDGRRGLPRRRRRGRRTRAPTPPTTSTAPSSTASTSLACSSAAP